MKKTWQIMVYEYKRNVFKKSFLLVLFSVPAMVALNIGFGLLIERFRDKNLPVGIVDFSGVFAMAIPAPQTTGIDKAIEFIPFQTVEEAQAFLKANKIQAFFLLPSDYAISRHIVLTYLEKPGENATQQFFMPLQQ